MFMLINVNDMIPVVTMPMIKAKAMRCFSSVFIGWRSCLNYAGFITANASSGDVRLSS